MTRILMVAGKRYVIELSPMGKGFDWSIRERRGTWGWFVGSEEVVIEKISKFLEGAEKKA